MRVTVALVPYDTSKRPAGVAEYQGEEVRVTVAVYVPVSPAYMPVVGESIRP